MSKQFFYKEMVPFIALVTVLFAEVGANILFKKATLKGLSCYVYIFYSLALSDLLLLIPLPFIIRRSSTGLSSINFPLLCKIFSLGFLILSVQLCVFKGIEYSSPTLNSAVGNRLPAFIFILAVLFRMEKIVLRSSSTQAKILGSIASIGGALIVVLYKGPKILNDPLSPSNSLLPLSLTTTPIAGSSHSNWVLGGFLLTLGYIIISIVYILLKHVIKLYPSEVIVVLLFNVFGTILAAPVCFLAEPNLSAWRLQPDVKLVAVIYTAFFSTFFSTVVHTWGICVKGPVYVSIFKPFSIVIAAAMTVIFLGETLYLGSVFGAMILSIGFYSVLWGKTKEEGLHEHEGREYLNNSQQSSKVPLLLQTDQVGEDFK